MINKALDLFNEHYQVNAKVLELEKGRYLFVLNNSMKEINGEGETVHFLMCRTTHFHFVPKQAAYYRAYNLGMMLVNDNIKDNSQVFYSENVQGAITLWALKAGEWAVVSTYPNKAELYFNLLNGRGVFAIINSVDKVKRKRWGWLLKRWFK